jgi:hypothetical protein
MPASEHQDHTPSPSALAPFVKSAACVHRIPLHVRDDRERPSDGAGRGELVEMICPTAKGKYFYQRDWTTQISLIRLDKSGFSRKLREPMTQRLIRPTGAVSPSTGRIEPTCPP